MLSVIILSVILLSVILLSVIKLNVLMLSVIMLNVVASDKRTSLVKSVIEISGRLVEQEAHA